MGALRASFGPQRGRAHIPRDDKDRNGGCQTDMKTRKGKSRRKVKT